MQGRKITRAEVCATLIAGVFLLNVCDAICTAFFVHNGLAVERNPLMAVLLREGLVYFFLGKMSLALFFCATTWITRSRLSILIVLVMTVILYVGINCYHMYGFYQLFSPVCS